MKNELSKQQKKVRNSVYGSFAIMHILLLMVLGITIYFLRTDPQLSRYPYNILSIVLTVSFLGVILSVKFWTIPALMKYQEEFKNPKQIQIGTKVLSSRTVKIGVGIAVFIICVISFLYTLHYRHTQRILNAEPVKKYNTVTPLKPKTQPPNTPATITSSHNHKE